MYHLAICEDNAQELKNLSDLCREILEEEHTASEINQFSNTAELEQELKEGNHFDILLLDIEMAERTGMEFAHELRNEGNRVSIIFVTGNEEYLKEGYSVQPIQYLLKPIDKESLREALLTDLKLNHSCRSISIHCGRRTIILPLSEIFFIESINHKVIVHTEDKLNELPVSMGKMTEMLPTDKFCRCHNGFLVNMEHISEIMRTEVLLSNGTRVPIGRRFYKEAQTAFIHFLNQSAK